MASNRTEMIVGVSKKVACLFKYLPCVDVLRLIEEEVHPRSTKKWWQDRQLIAGAPNTSWSANFHVAHLDIRFYRRLCRYIDLHRSVGDPPNWGWFSACCRDKGSANPFVCPVEVSKGYWFNTPPITCTVLQLSPKAIVDFVRVAYIAFYGTN